MVFIVDDLSLERLLVSREVRSLAHAGGAALLGPGTPVDRALTGSFEPQPRTNLGGPGVFVAAPYDPEATPEEIGKQIERAASITAGTDPSGLMVVVVGGSTSPSMLRQRDELLPIVLASGDIREIFSLSGPARTLTSASTNRDGVVTAEDVPVTILNFLRKPIRGAVGGAPIELVDEEPPFETHQRYLAQRRMYVPIGTGAAIAVTLFGFGCVALIWLRRRIPRIARTVGPWLALATPALAIGLLAAGNLRTLNYATVLPFVIGVTIVLPVAALSSRRNGVLRPPALLGAAVLVFFAAEALLGWPATLHTFIGGTALDGARFYGLPNVFIGLLLGSGLYLASVLRPYTGFVLLVGIGLFCGFPSLGANFGAAVTLFAAAGLWLALSKQRGFRIRGLAITAGTLIAGTALVLIANALAPAATHITGFVEEGGGGPGGILQAFLDRLGIGWDLLMRNPFAFVPVVGVLACLWLVLRPPRPIRESLDRYPQWRTALLVIVLGSIVAYFVNDTGPAAAGLGFGLAIGGLFYVPLAEEPVKMER
ncbi:MAG: hypothetical protein WD050_07910 [Actinomycetota bacterium]